MRKAKRENKKKKNNSKAAMIDGIDMTKWNTANDKW